MQLDTREISVSRDVALIEMTLDAQPIVRGLHEKIQGLRCLQFEDCQAAAARDAQHIQNAVFAAGICKHLECLPKFYLLLSLSFMPLTVTSGI